MQTYTSTRTARRTQAADAIECALFELLIDSNSNILDLLQAYAKEHDLQGNTLKAALVGAVTEAVDYASCGK